MSDETIVLRAVFRKARKTGCLHPPIGTGDLNDWKQSISTKIRLLGGKIIDQKSTPGQPTAFYHIDFEVAATLLDKTVETLRQTEIRNKYKEQLMPLYEIQMGAPRTPQV